MYPALAIVALVVYFMVGHSSTLFNLIGLSSPILIVVAVRLHQPQTPNAWRLIALGQFLFIAGDVVSYNYERFATALPQVFWLDRTFNPAGDVPYPGIADALYLAVYPCLMAGLLLMIRARTPGRDRASLLDSLMVAIGVGTLTWVLLVAPYIHIGDLDLKTKLTAVAYPTMDLLLAAVAIRLAVGAGRRPASFYLIIAAIGALFTTDAIYGWFGLYSAAGYQPGSGWLEAGWATFYVLLGTAALHPSMRQLTEPAPDLETKLSFGRLVVLATTSLMAPAIIAYQQMKRVSDADTEVLIGATIILFLLVVFRMWGLVRAQQQLVLREQALRRAGAALVTVTNRDGIYEAAIEAGRSLAGADATIRMCDEPDGNDELVIVSAAGGMKTCSARGSSSRSCRSGSGNGCFTTTPTWCATTRARFGGHWACPATTDRCSLPRCSSVRSSTASWWSPHRMRCREASPTPSEPCRPR